MTALEKGRHGPVAPVASLFGIRSVAPALLPNPEKNTSDTHQHTANRQISVYVQLDVSIDCCEEK
jgi:hypothetical protein